MVQPNVLCISIDSLRADYSSFIVDDEDTMPFLDSFADDATVFTKAISPSIWTLPVHTSVFTGLYPLEHQILDKGVELGSHPTFAEIFRSEGYATRAFYKSAWFETGDITRGFDSQNVSRESPDQPNSNVLGRHQIIGETIEAISPRLREIATALSNHVDVTYLGYDTDSQTIDRAIDWHADVSQPFCSFVHLKDLHWPYGASASDVARFSSHNALDLLWNRVVWQRRIYQHRDRIWADSMPVPNKQVEIIKEVYRACAYAADRLVKRLLTTLENAEVLENTIVVVFGDHGDLFGEDGIFGHQYSMADPLIRVPLLIRDPTDTLASGLVTDPVQLNDVYPTLLDICDSDVPATNSVNLANDDQRDHAFVHYRSRERSDEYTGREFPPSEQLCVWGSPSNKLVWYPEEGEYVGPAKDDERLREALDAHLEELITVQPKTSGVEVSDKVVQNLQQMGYL